MALPTYNELMASLTTIEPSNLPPDAQECPICLSAFSSADPPVVLHYSHTFCRSCIKQWLVENTACPLCRQDVISRAPSAPVSMPRFPAAWPGNPLTHYDSDTLAPLTAPSAISYSEMLNRGHGNPVDMERHGRRAMIHVRARNARYIVSLPMDVRYSAPDAQPMALGPEWMDRNRDEERQYTLDARSAILLLWRRYISEVTRQPCDGVHGVWQHPMVGALVEEVIGALRRWNGNVKSLWMLRFCLEQRFTRFENDDYPAYEYPRPESYDWIKEEILKVLVHALENEGAGACKEWIESVAETHKDLLEGRWLGFD